MKKLLIVLLAAALCAGAAACAPKYEAVKMDKDFPEEYALFDDAIVLDCEADDLEYVVAGGDVLDVVDFYDDLIGDIDFAEDDGEFEARGEYAGYEYRINIELDTDVFVRIRLKEAAEPEPEETPPAQQDEPPVAQTPMPEPEEEDPGALTDEPAEPGDVNLALLEQLGEKRYDTIYIRMEMDVMGFGIEVQMFQQDGFTKVEMDSPFGGTVSIYNPNENKTYTYMPGETVGSVAPGDQTNDTATAVDSEQLMQYVNEDTILREEMYSGELCIFLQVEYEEGGMTSMIKAWLTKDYNVPLYMEAYVEGELSLVMETVDYAVNEPIDPAVFELPDGVTFTE